MAFPVLHGWRCSMYLHGAEIAGFAGPLIAKDASPVDRRPLHLAALGLMALILAVVLVVMQRPRAVGHLT